MTVQGLYFAPTCSTPLPMTVPLCTISNSSTSVSTVQATIISDNYDNSPSSLSNKYEMDEGGLPFELSIVKLPLYIATWTISDFTINHTCIQLQNAIELFFVEKQHCNVLLFNLALQSIITLMWPSAQCTFKGRLLVVM